MWPFQRKHAKTTLNIAGCSLWILFLCAADTPRILLPVIKLSLWYFSSGFIVQKLLWQRLEWFKTLSIHWNLNVIHQRLLREFIWKLSSKVPVIPSIGKQKNYACAVLCFRCGSIGPSKPARIVGMHLWRNQTILEVTGLIEGLQISRKPPTYVKSTPNFLDSLCRFDDSLLLFVWFG